ncbi:anti-sigma-factor antagonist (STAS) domain protein [Burkholderiales bacterium GJ-E10]|nr:anti-sigma-factor antagonist (STAS) domain protein [Burkholderiales bacterium GJ-E10]
METKEIQITALHEIEAHSKTLMLLCKQDSMPADEAAAVRGIALRIRDLARAGVGALSGEPADAAAVFGD